MTLDFILVKYLPHDDNEILRLKNFNNVYGFVSALRSKYKGTGILVKDNTADNIGLARARNELVERSKADIVCFMDFDLDFGQFFHNIMAMKVFNDVTAGITFPFCEGLSTKKDHDGYKYEWEEKEIMPCNCFYVKRSYLNKLGRFDERYHTAYADWDLILRVLRDGQKIFQHNSSTVKHHSISCEGKRYIWDKDHKEFLDRWTKDLDRSKM